MRVNLSTEIEINDNPNPRYNEQLANEWDIRNEAKQILTTQLFNLALAFSLNHNVEPIKKFANCFNTSIIHKPRPTVKMEVIDDAKMLIEEYLIDEIIEAITEEFELDEIEFSDTLHEVITDQYYNKDEAIRVLDELYDYEETDSRLWEGQGWEEVLSTKATYTYSNAVYEIINRILDEIDDNIDIQEIQYDVATEWMSNNTNDELRELEDDMNIDDVMEYVQNNEQNFDNMVKQEITKRIEQIIEEY